MYMAVNEDALQRKMTDLSVNIDCLRSVLANIMIILNECNEKNVPLSAYGDKITSLKAWGDHFSKCNHTVCNDIIQMCDT